MKRKSKLAATLGSFAVFMTLPAGPAWSQEAGVYVGAALGKAEYRNACEGVTVSCDHKDNAGKIFAGYQFGRYFAAEIAYNDLGEASAGGAAAEFVAWELVGVGSIPLIERLSVYGKLGFYRAETTINGPAAVPGFTPTPPAGDRNSDVTFGFGARYGITGNLSVRAEWQRYVAVGGPDVGDTDIDVFGVGLMYRF
jgi:OOP family OmpA-OmpF porin